MGIVTLLLGLAMMIGAINYADNDVLFIGFLLAGIMFGGIHELEEIKNELKTS